MSIIAFFGNIKSRPSLKFNDGVTWKPVAMISKSVLISVLEVRSSKISKFRYFLQSCRGVRKRRTVSYRNIRPRRPETVKVPEKVRTFVYLFNLSRISEEKLSSHVFDLFSTLKSQPRIIFSILSRIDNFELIF